MAAITTDPSNFSVEDAEEFLLCARYGETEDMLIYLRAEQNIPVNYKNPNSGNTALHLASANGHLDCVKILLLKGATDTPNNTGNYALHWAVQRGIPRLAIRHAA